MNFLELAQETRRLSGVGGTGPVNVEIAAGMELKIVNYVSNAWIDIQTHPKNWKWMWEDYEVDLQPGPGTQPLQTILNTREYQLVDSGTLDPAVARIRVDTFRSYLTATGISDRQRMTYVHWRQFRQRYGIVDEAAGRPIQATRAPNGNLVLYPKPDDVYSIEFEVFKTPQILLVNDDIPEMPARYHMLIVYEALKRFGKAENAEEVIALGEQAGGSDGNEGRPVSGLWRALIWEQEYKDASLDDEDEMMEVRTAGGRGGWRDY